MPMSKSLSGDAALAKVKSLQKSLETSLKDISKKVMQADRSIEGLKKSIKSISKDKAQAKLLNFLGKSRKDLMDFQQKIEKQVETLKVQAKAITEAERAKRRARSRSK